MTREEVIKHIKDIICENNTVKHSNIVVFEEEKEALRIAIKALEQEPCDDAISREAVLNILQDYVFEEDEIESVTDECQNNMAESIARNIVQLPPVTPSRRKGHWIKSYKYPHFFVWECSECKKKLPRYSISSDFCPNCGAEMESEV